MIKDSGKRQQFDSGMVRDTTDGKVDYTLAFDGPMFERYARHLTAGAKKYAKRNWMQATGEAELARFRESALRHFVQWLRGDTDEDHAAAVWFNVNGAEFVKGLRGEQVPQKHSLLPGVTWVGQHPHANCQYEATVGHVGLHIERPKEQVRKEDTLYDDHGLPLRDYPRESC